jgi:hypothetical protein
VSCTPPEYAIGLVARAEGLVFRHMQGRASNAEDVSFSRIDDEPHNGEGSVVGIVIFGCPCA